MSPALGDISRSNTHGDVATLTYGSYLDKKTARGLLIYWCPRRDLRIKIFIPVYGNVKRPQITVRKAETILLQNGGIWRRCLGRRENTTRSSLRLYIHNGGVRPVPDIIKMITWLRRSSASGNGGGVTHGRRRRLIFTESCEGTRAGRRVSVRSGNRSAMGYHRA